MKDAYVIKALGLILTITIVIATIFVSSYMSLKQGSFDPQIQLSQDIAAQLNKNENPQNLPNANPDKSLGLFVQIYNKSYQQTDASGVIIEEESIKPPVGVFKYTQEKGLYAFTWKAANDIRYSAVVEPYETGYVLSARSLALVEQREKQLFVVSIVGWILATATALGTLAGLEAYKTSANKRSPHTQN